MNLTRRGAWVATLAIIAFLFFAEWLVQRILPL